MASWAILGVPAVGLPVTMMNAAAASKGEKPKAGLLDWLSGALDKNSLLETDPILQKVDGAAAPPPPRVAGGAKKGAPAKKEAGGGGGFFGLGGKK